MPILFLWARRIFLNFVRRQFGRFLWNFVEKKPPFWTDDFFGACCRKAMAPKGYRLYLSSPTLVEHKMDLLKRPSPYFSKGFFLIRENSARSFSDRSFLPPPSGRGRPRLRVINVRTEMLVFPGFRGPDRSFCPRTSAGISAWTSAEYPAPKLTLWAAFSFLIFSVQEMDFVKQLVARRVIFGSKVKSS